MVTAYVSPKIEVGGRSSGNRATALFEDGGDLVGEFWQKRKKN